MARPGDVRWRWKTPRTSREWKHLLNMPGLVDELKDCAGAMQTHAEVSAPVDSGEYRDSFKVVSGKGRKRAVARLINTAEHAGFVEFGAGRTPAYHTLANALASEATGTTGGTA